MLSSVILFAALLQTTQAVVSNRPVSSADSAPAQQAQPYKEPIVVGTEPRPAPTRPEVRVEPLTPNESTQLAGAKAALSDLQDKLADMQKYLKVVTDEIEQFHSVAPDETVEYVNGYLIIRRIPTPSVLWTPSPTVVPMSNAGDPK